IHEEVGDHVGSSSESSIGRDGVRPRSDGGENSQMTSESYCLEELFATLLELQLNHQVYESRSETPCVLLSVPEEERTEIEVP
ncbi:hypothetical protein PENTCL1PPCAC_3194, partial [Pristionchus entomophagus]